MRTHQVTIGRNRGRLLLLLLLSLVLPVTPGSAEVDTRLQVTAAGPTVDNAPATHELSAEDAREDLTVFFAIGIVIDILLVAAFIVWAVGQWRKPRQ